jgi:hypothetical protein
MRYDIRTGIKNTKAKITAGVIGMMALVFPAAISLAGGAASAASTFTLSPWTYDPGNACPGVTSMWDYSTGNSAPSLLLNKPCLTTTNASAGASINGVNGITLTELNFDYMGYCGAGAPRFNVVTSDNVTHFVGCTSGTVTGTSNGYTHVVFDPTNPTQFFPVIAPGTTVQSIDLVQDETGQVNLDNISINDQVISGPNTATSKDACKKDGWMTLQRADGSSFKNQGDCIQYVNTGK